LDKQGHKESRDKYSLRGKQFKEKVGTFEEGITASYCSKLRAKKREGRQLAIYCHRDT
jgi:hypothetical protein